MKVKQITKHAAAARLNAPKINSRSHLLTVVESALADFLAAERESVLYSRFKLDGSVHEANACDDNGCAGTWSVLLALVAEQS